MTVTQLIKELQRLPPHLTVVVTQHSDYTDDVSVGMLRGVHQGGYVMRVSPHHEPTMRADDIRRVADFAFIG